MFLPLSNTPRDYHWGSNGDISRLLQREPTGAPEAEYWLGAHPGSPGIVTVGDRHLGLDAWLAEHGRDGAAGTDRLPYLLKVLAAGAPLSLQVHPSREQARLGCAREDALGIPRDAAHRNYRDDNHKPEIIVALEDGFTALCGIRPESERLQVLAELGLDGELDGSRIDALFAHVLSPEARVDVQRLLERALEAASRVDPHSAVFDSVRLMQHLAEHYPGDPGVLLSLMLNLVTLRAGEALYLPAGNLHAYIHGIGVELMADSDNVLRGGLTEKHIDVPELLATTTWAALPVPRIAPIERHGARVFAGDVDDFELHWVSAEADVLLSGPAIVLNLGATAQLAGSLSEAALPTGAAVFVTPDEQRLRVHGDRVVIAMPGARLA